jgi:uncharacterized protein (TIGR02300 family)
LAKPELGAKQLCPNCAAKFYDLNKRPAVCPKCQTAFDPEEVVKSRKGRRGLGASDYEDDEAPKKAEVENDGFEEEADDTPEIDQAIDDDVIEADDEAEEEGAGAGKPAPSEDLGVDFAVDDEDVEGAGDDDDDVFLEDEDDEFSEDDIGGLPGEGDDRD